MKKVCKFDKIAFKMDKDVVDEITKEAAEYGVDVNECDVLRKGWATEEKVKLEDGSRSAIKYVSARTVDQAGDVIIPKGVTFKQFIKTGMPVFYNHSYATPQIGRDEWIKADDWGIKVKQVYADTGPGTLSDILWKLTQQNMNKLSSVGIIPLEMIREGDDRFKGAVKALAKEWPEFKAVQKSCRRIITKSLLFEHSDCSMACNSDTEVLAVSKMFRKNGADDALLKQLGLPLTSAESAESAELTVDPESLEYKTSDTLDILDFTIDAEAIEDSVKNVLGDELEGIDLVVEIDDKAEVAEVAEVEEVVEKKKVTLVRAPNIVKLVQAPTITSDDVNEMVQKEIRRRLGRLI